MFLCPSCQQLSTFTSKAAKCGYLSKFNLFEKQHPFPWCMPCYQSLIHSHQLAKASDAMGNFNYFYKTFHNMESFSLLKQWKAHPGLLTTSKIFDTASFPITNLAPTLVTRVPSLSPQGQRATTIMGQQLFKFYQKAKTPLLFIDLLKSKESFRKQAFSSNLYQRRLRPQRFLWDEEGYLSHLAMIERLEPKYLLLIDDFYVSGETINSAMELIKQNLKLNHPEILFSSLVLCKHHL